MTAEEREKLRELAAAGISRVEAARVLGRSHSMVVKRVQEMGLDWRPPPKPPAKPKPPRGPAPRLWTADDDRQLTELAAAGVPIGQAAHRIDRQYNTVVRHSKALGLSWQHDTQARARARDLTSLDVAGS
jgi:hypothetical protein